MNLSARALIFCLFILSTSCVGPISPFGPIEFWSGDGEEIEYGLLETAETAPNSSIEVYPKRQVLHKKSDLKIELKNPTDQFSQLQLKIIYDKKDVTNTFLKFSKQKLTKYKTQYTFNKLNLKPNRKHQIDIYSSSDGGKRFYKLSYLPPSCSLNQIRGIASTDPFSPNSFDLDNIYEIARTHQINPNLMAGLIAQESGFRSGQVSSAKAVGLTQVTTLASKEIQKLRPHWSIDKRFETMSVPEIKKLIELKEITAQNDWRLNPLQSIEGGVLYLQHLISYWSRLENKALLSSLPKISDTDVILASYNSGAFRVKDKIKNSGYKWLDDPELSEAFKYVSKVSSYCYHFTEEQQ